MGNQGDLSALMAATFSLLPGSTNDKLHALLKEQPPRLAEAFDILEEMKAAGGNASPDRMSYTMVIHGCAMAMLSEPVPTPSTAGATTQAAAADAFTHALLDKALELYHEMKMQKLQPSTDTLNSLILACGKAGQLQRAWTIFEYMMEEGDALKLPNMTTINILMKEIRRHEAHDKAFLLLERVAEINAQVNSSMQLSLCCFFAGCCSASPLL